MTIVVKGNERAIVRINPRGSNDRSAKVTGDIFDSMGAGAGIGFSSDIKAVPVRGINRSFDRLKRRTNRFFQFVEQSGTESIAKQSEIEMFYMAPNGEVTGATFRKKTVDMGIPF